MVLADGEGGYAILAGSEAYAGGLRDLDCALGSYGYFGRDYVFVPVAFAGGDVAGEREIGERGQRDVLGTADAGFEHAAAPDGDAVLLTKIVNAPPEGVAADAPELYVDDFAGPEGDGGSACS